MPKKEVPKMNSDITYVLTSCDGQQVGDQSDDAGQLFNVAMVRAEVDPHDHIVWAIHPDNTRTVHAAVGGNRIGYVCPRQGRKH